LFEKLNLFPWATTSHFKESIYDGVKVDFAVGRHDGEGGSSRRRIRTDTPGRRMSDGSGRLEGSGTVDDKKPGTGEYLETF
jgi:hypothetical protein